jgi:hypothetical protein
MPAISSTWITFLALFFVLLMSGVDVIRHWNQQRGGIKLDRFWSDYLLIIVSLYVMGSIALTGR